MAPRTVDPFGAAGRLGVAVAGLAHRQLLDEWRGGPVHAAALARVRTQGLAELAPREVRPRDPARGRAILAGRMTLAGATLEIGPGGDPFDTPCPTRRFAAELHRFAWLPDLLAIEGEGAREALRLFLDWRRLFAKVTPFVWGAETLERRVHNLACGARAMSEAASDMEAAALAESLARQARHLSGLSEGPARAAERACAVAVAGAALGGREGETVLARALPRLGEALDVAVLPDGGLRTRSPEQGLELLFDLLSLDDALLQREREAPPSVARAIDRISAALRFFTLADRRLASFQGGEAASRARVEAALAHEDPEARTYSYLPQTGYQRLTGRALQVIADAAAPAEGAWSEAACAQPLAIEVTAGSDRLIANSGWSPDAAGPQAMRMTAAGCTATLSPAQGGDASAGSPLTGWRARARGPRLVAGPARVEARRNESEAGVWLEMSHDGWVGRFGLVHERRLFLDPHTDELRGEDHFAPSADASGRRAARYAVHFHLPPEVRVSLARDRRSVLLRGASDRGWWLRNDAEEVALEPSVHFEDGLPRRSVQVVLRGAAPAGEGARVRWKLTAVDPETRSGRSAAPVAGRLA